MARYSRRNYRGRKGSYYGRYNKGQEAARRHIEEGEAFSREIGGTDKDVKRYFFSLGRQNLESILKEYGQKYGYKAEDYARETIPRWHKGTTKMSGLVAKRLFNLLPPRMPIAMKYELAENVWKHFGPSSSHSYMVGPTADVPTIASIVSEKLDEVVSRYDIPENVQNRFNWLAAGDVRIKEQLLNYFRQMEKRLAVEKVNAELPVLQRQMREHGEVTGRAKTIIQVHRHNVSIWVEKQLEDEIREGTPVPEWTLASGSRFSWFWWIVGALILLYLLSR